jgi:hypothetical protein
VPNETILESRYHVIIPLLLNLEVTTDKVYVPGKIWNSMVLNESLIAGTPGPLITAINPNPELEIVTVFAAPASQVL